MLNRCCFFFSSRRRHTRWNCDWSSDVCSSDLVGATLLGGRRWIVIGHISFQPSEALKLGACMMAAAYFTAMRGKVGSWLYGLGGFAAILALPAMILVLQPDIGTLGVVCGAVFALYWS